MKTHNNTRWIFRWLFLILMPVLMWGAGAQLSINDVSITETEGDITMDFNVSCTIAPSSPLDFNVTTISTGSATAWNGTTGDYVTQTNQTYSIQSGQKYKIVSITIKGDFAAEATETFKVQIASTTGIDDGEGIGTIYDNDNRKLSIQQTATVGESDSYATLTVSTTATASIPIPFTYTTSDGNATQPSDYTARNITTSIPAGSSSTTIQIPIIGDTTKERTEVFNVALTSTSVDVNSSADNTTVTITDDDSYSVSVASTIDTTEGTSANPTPQTLTFTINQIPLSGDTVDASYTIAGSGANQTDNSDFNTTSGSVSFSSSDSVTSKSSIFGVIADSIAEPNETYTISLSASGATISPASIAGTINNDDSGSAKIAQSNSSRNEGDTNTYTVSLDFTPTSSVTVNYAVTNKGTTSASDHNGTSGSVTFTASQTSKTFQIRITNDSDEEPDEYFDVNLTSATGASIGSPKGVTTKINASDGRRLSISPASVSVPEGNSGITYADFNITLSDTPLNNVKVNYAVTGPTSPAATAADFDNSTWPSGTVYFASGASGSALIQTIRIPIVGDTSAEPNENFTVSLSGEENATVSTRTAAGVITNDDFGSVSLAQSSVSVTEGNTNTYTVSLDFTPTSSVTVGYTITNISASGSDHNGTNGSVIFSASQTSKTFQIRMTDDLNEEPTESFDVNLTSVTGASLSSAYNVRTNITDNDGRTLSISPSTVSIVEGNSGTTYADYNITLSGIPLNSVKVTYGVTGGATDPANAADFVGGTLPTGSVTFAAGTTTLYQTIHIPIQGDTAIEPNENFTVSLSGEENATVSTRTAAGVITNDDTSITIVSTASRQEGPCNTVYADVNVSLGQAVNYDVIATYSTTAGTATAGSDYGAAGGSVTIYAGSTQATIQIPIYSDTDVDGGETFFVNLTGTTPAGITIVNDKATVTIIDNQDRNVTGFSANDQLEGDSGTANSLTYTLTLCEVLTSPVTINYTYAGTATRNDDYDGTSTSFTFPAGTLNHSFTIPIIGDIRREGNETVVINLQSTAGINLTDATATGIIIDDDDHALWIRRYNNIYSTVYEGNTVGNTTDVRMEVCLAEYSNRNNLVTAGQDVFFDANTTDHNATLSDNDYVKYEQRLKIVAGQSCTDFNVSIKQDTKVEANERFNVIISNPTTDVPINDNIEYADITDDDNRTLSISAPASVIEGHIDFDQNVTISLNSSSPVNRTFHYSISGGTAIDGADFTGVSNQSITIDANTTSKQIPIRIKGDLVQEALNETLIFSITSDDGFSVAGSPVTLTIEDDDGNFSVDSPAAITEGDVGDKNITFTVTLSRDMNTTVYVDYATSDLGEAVGGDDYAQTTGTLTFAPNERTKEIMVAVHGDTVYESGTERFRITLTPNASSPNMVMVNNGYGAGVGLGTITDDDARTVLISSPDVYETETNTTYNFTIQLQDTMIDDLNLTYKTVDGSAHFGTDYVKIPDTNITITGGTNPIIDVNVTIIGNYKSELDKSFNLEVTTSKTGITFSGGTMTILNDDGDLSITPVSISKYEGNTSQITTYSFDINLTRAANTGSDITVHYQTHDVNATAGDDYTAASGTLTFIGGSGIKSQRVDVNVIGDIVIEGDEAFDLNISSPQDVTITNATSRGYILEDDGRYITIDDAVIDENDSGTITTLLTVSLNEISGSPVTINYDIDSSAADSSDFLITSGSITIPAGDKNATISVTTYGDVTWENDEVINVGISTTTGGFQVTDPYGTVTIRNDDGQITIHDLNVLEGDTINTVTDVNVTWDDTYDVDINVSYTISDGTATIADHDYTATSGSFIIPAGAAPGTIQIPVTIIGDYYSESNEYFKIDIQSDQNVTFYDQNGTVTIENDDNETVGVVDNAHFREFQTRFRKNLYGDFVATGAPSMCVVDSGGACNWNYGGELLDANTTFIDQIPAMDGNNSSSAKLTLALEANDKILWAGLYWQGHIHGTDPNDITDAISGYNNVTFRTSDGNDHNITADITSGSDEIGYYNFKSSTLSSRPGFRMFYQGFKDVTTEVNASIIPNFTDGNFTFSVSNIKSTAGVDTSISDPEASWGGLKYGNFAGWSLVVVYEKEDKSNPDDLRNVTIADGYKFLIAPSGSSRSMDINISGFKTPKTGPVDSKMLFFGGLGEKNIHGDILSIADKDGNFTVVSDSLNGTENFLNDTIGLLGTNIDTARTYNPGIDLDIIDVSSGMSNDQNATTIRMEVNWIDDASDTYYNGKANVTDQTFAGLLGFSTQLYQPVLCYDYTYRQNGIYLKPADFNTSNLLQKPLIKGALNSGTIEAGIFLRNVESDFPIQGLSFFTDMNGTKITYNTGTAAKTSLNGTIFTTATESSTCLDYDDNGTTSTQHACYSETLDDASKYNLRIGLGGSVHGYTKYRAGYMDSGDFLYTKFDLTPINVSDQNGTDLNLKLNYYIDLGDGEIPYEYTLGKNIKLCQPTGSYTPALGQFNVIDSANKTNGIAGVNNLYTQVVKRPFDVDVAFYGESGGAYRFSTPPSSEVNTTVLVELIDADAYNDVNASCANPAAAISPYGVFVEVRASDTNNTVTLPAQGTDYYQNAVKNGAFRVWWFDDGHGNLVQNWKAYNTLGGDGNVTEDSTSVYKIGSINGLFDPSKHGDCNASCIGRETTVGGGSCLECMKNIYMHPTCSRDNFSVRPESYDVRIYDINQTTGSVLYVDSKGLSENSGHAPNYPTSSELNLSAGYKYAFDLNATNHTNDLKGSLGYTRYFGGDDVNGSEYNATMYWNSPLTDTECNDVNSTSLVFNVINGQMSDNNQSHGNVGQYLLNIIDKTWTAVDWRDTSHHYLSDRNFSTAPDCIVGDHNTAGLGNAIGCDINSSHTNGSLVYKDHKMQFKPYKFDLSTMIFNVGRTNEINASGNGFVYDANLSREEDLNISLRSTVQIKAVGYDNSTLSNFVGGCYAKDINITIGHNASLVLTMPYTSRQKIIDINGSTLFDSNKTTVASNSLFTIDDSNFSKHSSGVVVSSIYLNFDRNNTGPLDPQNVQYTDFNVSYAVDNESNMSADGLYNGKEVLGEHAMDFNVTHVYGRLLTKDVRVFGNSDFTAPIWYEVYNAPNLAGTQLTPNKTEKLWFVNSLHSDTNDGNGTITFVQQGAAMNTFTEDDGTLNNGVKTYNMVGKTPPYQAKMHIDVDPWLWYGIKASGYSDPSGVNTDCLTHPCFNVTVMPAIGASGSSKGTLDKTNKASEKKGNGWHSTSDYAPAIQ